MSTRFRKCSGKDGEGRWWVVCSINNTSSCSDKCTRAPPTSPVLTPESINDQNWNCVSIKKQSILRRIPAKNWVLLCKSVVVNFYHSQWLLVGICNGKRVVGIIHNEWLVGTVGKRVIGIKRVEGIVGKRVIPSISEEEQLAWLLLASSVPPTGVRWASVNNRRGDGSFEVG